MTKNIALHVYDNSNGKNANNDINNDDTRTSDCNFILLLSDCPFIILREYNLKRARAYLIIKPLSIFYRQSI